jgi:hypothetical protein
LSASRSVTDISDVQVVPYGARYHLSERYIVIRRRFMQLKKRCNMKRKS